MKRLSLFILVVLQFVTLSAQREANKEFDYGDHEKYPVYYKETEYTLEPIDELPYDTIFINDTIYISDIDAFLKQYNCNLKQFVEKYGAMHLLIDSINKLSSQRLYYNFFLPNDTLNNMSNRFIVKEFKVGEDLNYTYRKRELDYEKINSPDSIRREILFQCEGAKTTDLFLNNPDAIRRHISALFTIMQEDTLGIKGVNLFFPDFTFKEKRAMTQFIKTVRIVMDASLNFKSKDTRLTVIFLRGEESKEIDRNFQYCLMQEASEVIFLSSADLIDNYALGGNRMTVDEMEKIDFFHQLQAHFYIARFSIDTLNILEQSLIEFKGPLFERILSSDYSENTWEIYLFILIGIFIVLCVFGILYYTYLPLSTFVNNNAESILFVAIVVVLEILALIICIFQYMCKEDSFSALNNKPILVFALPLILVFIVPFLNGVKKKRRIP